MPSPEIQRQSVGGTKMCLKTDNSEAPTAVSTGCGCAHTNATGRCRTAKIHAIDRRVLGMAAGLSEACGCGCCCANSWTRGFLPFSGGSTNFVTSCTEPVGGECPSVDATPDKNILPRNSSPSCTTARPSPMRPVGQPSPCQVDLFPIRNCTILSFVVSSSRDRGGKVEEAVEKRIPGTQAFIPSFHSNFLELRSAPAHRSNSQFSFASDCTSTTSDFVLLLPSDDPHHH